MQCPNGDGDLSVHTTSGENNLTISYSTCPTCRGYWMDSFAANFIKLSPYEMQEKIVPANPATFVCPVCQTHLERALGENIPDSASVYTCPNHHGYFFPSGQLAAFKKAQKAKITYHKLWNLPLASVASVLLAGVAFFVISGAIRQPQEMRSQAQQVFTGQKAYIAEETDSVLFSATTSIDTTVTLHIPLFDNFSREMTTTNKRTHLLYVPDLPVGEYKYYFTMTAGEREEETPEYILIKP